MTMLLASLAFTGACDVSPVFRLGSGAGATNHPPPLASSNASMPLVAFVLLFGLIGFTMLLLSWTYLVSWQDTAGYWDHHFHRKVTKALAKHLSMSEKQLDEYKTAVCSMPKDIPRTGPKKRRCYLFTKRMRSLLNFIVYAVFLPSAFIETEAFATGTLPLRTTNPIIPIITHVSTYSSSILSSIALPPTKTYFTHTVSNITYDPHINSTFTLHSTVTDQDQHRTVDQDYHNPNKTLDNIISNDKYIGTVGTGNGTLSSASVVTNLPAPLIAGTSEYTTEENQHAGEELEVVTTWAIGLGSENLPEPRLLRGKNQKYDDGVELIEYATQAISTIVVRDNRTKVIIAASTCSLVCLMHGGRGHWGHRNQGRGNSDRQNVRDPPK